MIDVSNDELSGLPAADRVRQGLRDLDRGRWSDEALLLAAARSRLLELGLPIPQGLEFPEEPELALYASLCTQGDDPYGRYNAMRRELDSFVVCLGAQQARARRAAVDRPLAMRSSPGAS